jgi:hypothetical protein
MAVAAHRAGEEKSARLVIDLPLREPAEGFIQRHRALESRQRRPETEVDAGPEGEMLVEMSADVETVRIWESALVPPRGACRSARHQPHE